MKYLEQYKQLHQNKQGYGATGESMAGVIYRQLLKLKPMSILDYGCGKSKLVELLRWQDGVVLNKYDPAVAGVDKIPYKKYELVITTDVLEHIPEEELKTNLDRISGLSETSIHAISLRESGNVLPDGTPCHVTVKPQKWWEQFLSKWYKVSIIKRYKDKVMFLCQKL